MASTSFNLGTDGTTAINTLLAEEANRIGQDIYTRTLHTSPWMDLIKQSAFPDGMGYQLTTLIYDRAIPVQTVGGTTVGVKWSNLGTLNTEDNRFNQSLLEQPLKDAAYDIQGARGGASDGSTGGDGNSTDQRSFINFAKRLKKYSLARAIIESPRIALEDLRFAAYRQEQLRAIMDNMTTATRFTWENRNRDEFEVISDNLIVCKTTATAFAAGREGLSVQGTATNSTVNSITNFYNATANISNAVLDKAYFQLVRKGAGTNAYGKENGRPIFALVCSSEASYALQTEAGFRDDVRYNASKVSDLIAPLGVEKAFRGYYHLVDDLAPRFNITSDAYDRKQPYNVSAVSAVTDSADYESATHELAFIMHPEVLECQVPTAFSGSNGITGNPLNYRGDFKWTNILNEITNPDGTIGFFRGVLATASKPIKTDFGYAVLFQRTSTTPAAN